MSCAWCCLRRAREKEHGSDAESAASSATENVESQTERLSSKSIRWRESVVGGEDADEHVLEASLIDFDVDVMAS